MCAAQEPAAGADVSCHSHGVFDFSGLEARLTAHVTERMIGLAKLRAGQRVVDVGCGDGVVAIAALKRVQPGGAVHGFDPDAEAIGRARAHTAQGLTWERSTAEAFCSPDQFDAALARWSLASMPDPLAAITAIAHTLRPGAPFVFATWASAHWWSIPRAVIERFVALPRRPEGAPGAMRFSNIDHALVLLAPRFQVEVVEQVDTAVVEGAPELLVAWVEHVFGGWMTAVPDLDACRAALRAEFIRHPRLSGTTHLVLARRSLGT